jgi:hypothetical protein
MVMNIATRKESGGAALRFESQGNAPPGVLLLQHGTPLCSGTPVLNRMVCVRFTYPFTSGKTKCIINPN